MPSNIFINCPFDKDYRPLLHLMGFVLTYLEFDVHISNTTDGTSSRLDKIINLMNEADLSIHDISRMKSSKKNEMARFNMPFELGIDIGLKAKDREKSRFSLVIDKHQYRYREALSDLSGCDIDSYGEEDQEYNLASILRQWLTKLGYTELPPATLLFNTYRLFNAELNKELKLKSWSQRDIDNLAFGEYLHFVRGWSNAYKHILTQQQLSTLLKAKFLKARSFQKTGHVWGRDAIDGEFVTTITSDGVETNYIAQKGDLLVKNNTEAQEQYIVTKNTIDKRYTSTGKKKGKWTQYKSIGKLRALQFDPEIQAILKVESKFLFTAPWGTKMECKLGDYLVKPHRYHDIYRIARKEFEETYQKI